MNKQTGWSELEVALVQQKSNVITARSIQPLKLLNPKAQGTGCHVVLSSYGGGMVAGDTIRLRVSCGTASTLFLSTQANTKIFKSEDGAVAAQHVAGELAEHSLAVVFPDPVVLQEASRYKQVQHWELQPNSLLLVADWFHSGRMDAGERYLFHSFLSELQVRVNGKLVLLDRFSFQPEEHIATSPANFDQYQTMLSVYLVGSPADARFQLLAQTLLQLKMTETESLHFDLTAKDVVVSVTKVKEGVFILRAMAKSRLDLQPLCDTLLEELSKPELLGYNPVRRKY
ncbi:urease accessory protein UreD [Botryobacter ruber]|uniref:urease accessory protein UreD n=1 Tax=Botryobacter ruber TaxID=2171629 RepID=UPI0013E35649|nr:urease accessory protein UreD [Botryobacter ruber]